MCTYSYIWQLCNMLSTCTCLLLYQVLYNCLLNEIQFYTWTTHGIMNKYMYFAKMYIVLFGECYQFIINTYGMNEWMVNLEPHCLKGSELSVCYLPASPAPQGGEEGCSLVDWRGCPSEEGRPHRTEAETGTAVHGQHTLHRTRAGGGAGGGAVDAHMYTHH